MAGRAKVDVSKLSPEEREKYEKRKAAARAPRPAYLVYRMSDAGDLEIVAATRSADDVLAQTTNDRTLKYAAFAIK